MRRIACLCLALLGAVSGCSTARDVGRYTEQRLNPFASTRVALLSVERLGPYLAVEVRLRGALLTFFAPAAEADCAQLLRPEASVTYRQHGHFGRFEDGALRCEAVGVGALAAWRDRRPRDRRDASVVPRATARFREIGREGDVALARGRFPLASRVGVPSGFDLIAFLQLPACAEPLARGIAAMEFRAAGQDAIRLVAPGEPCVVRGFATPLDGSRDTE